MKANVYKIELLIIDTELYDTKTVINTIENEKHLGPEVMRIESVEVEWSDDHPLNHESTYEAAFYELFNPAKSAEKVNT